MSKDDMPMYGELYERLVGALGEAEMPHRAPGELADPMAIAELTNDILKRCRETIYHELQRRPDVVMHYGNLSAREAAELAGQAPRLKAYRPWER